ncbi:hypothetical protein BH11ARM2_BH11ARM2_27380 [soil metagenome]
MVSTVVDTGFTDALSLPQEMLAGLPRVGTNEFVLADGSVSEFELVTVDIEWIDGIRRVDALVGDAALIGMGLLQGCRLTADIVPNGLMTVTLIP